MGVMTRAMTKNLSETLVTEQCCNCHVWFAMPKELQDRRKRDHATFYCPNGHPQHYSGPSEEEKLKRALQAAKQSAAHFENRLEDERRAHEATARSRAAMKGQVTKIKNAAAKGECPCCGQVFANLMEHMKHKHPAYESEPIEGE